MTRISPFVTTLAAVALYACAGCGETPGSAGVPAHFKALTPAQTEEVASGQAYSPTARLTRAQLIARASPICASFNERRAGIQLGSPHAARELAPLEAYEWWAIGELTNLTPPPALSYSWEQTLNDMRTIAETTATAASYAQTGAVSASGSLTPTIAKAEGKLRRLARGDRIAACA